MAHVVGTVRTENGVVWMVDPLPPSKGWEETLQYLTQKSNAQKQRRAVWAAANPELAREIDNG